MINDLLKAEYKKLLTVRSTYIITALVVILTCLATFVTVTSNTATVEQNQTEPATTEQPAPENQPVEVQQEASPPAPTTDLLPDRLKSITLENVAGISSLVVVGVILLMAHEYRYNTITYSLIASNSRSRFLVTKAITAIIYTVVLSLLAMVVTVSAVYVTASIKHLHLLPQDFNVLYVLGRSLLYMTGFSLIGLAFITIVRNLTAAMVMIFVLPTIDSIVGIAFRSHSNPASFLPFSALGRIITDTPGGESGVTTSLVRAILVFVIYLIGAWAVAWWLFMRRDATK